MKEQKEKSKELVKPTTKEVANVNGIDTFSSIEELLAFGAKIAKSKLTPLKTAEDVMAAVLMGRDLGIKTMVAVNNIYPIEGKASSGIHIINALLLKAGVTWEVIEDYTPLYDYIDSNKVNYNQADIDADPDKFQRIGAGTLKSAWIDEKIQIVRSNLAVDKRTTIQFKRMVAQPDGTYRELTIKISRCISQFNHLITKANWKENPQTMLMNRIKSIGGREIADDVLLGMYETSELADANNIPYEVDAEGNAKVRTEDVTHEEIENEA